MGIFLTIVLIILAAALMIGVARGHKNTVRIRFKAYETREEAFDDTHDLSSSGWFEQEIVGEASYQNQIRLIMSRLPSGYNIVQATLELEDNNPHDNKAVAVKIGGVTVGYLARDTARAYRKLAAKDNIPAKATCPAIIKGTGDKMNYGIWLGIPEI